MEYVHRQLIVMLNKLIDIECDYAVDYSNVGLIYEGFSLDRSEVRDNFHHLVR